MALEPEDRTEEIVGGTKPIDAKQSTAQMPRKEAGDCRMVVEFPFHFAKDFLRKKSDEHNRNYIDGVDYLRELKKQYDQGDIDLGDLYNLTIDHGQGDLRIEAAK